MGKKLTPDKLRISIAIVTAIVMLLWSSAIGQMIVIVAGGKFSDWIAFDSAGDEQRLACNV